MRSIRHLVPFAAITVFAMLLVAACSSSSPSSPTPTPTPTPGGGGGGTADVTISISGFAFSAGAVKAGQTVSWKNNDSATHTATADNGAFNTGNIAPGATSAPIMMSAAGSIAYHCAIHPNMVASLQVQ